MNVQLEMVLVYVGIAEEQEQKDIWGITSCFAFIVSVLLTLD